MNFMSVCQHIISMISLVWAGMIIGISFLEAWAKFKTPGLSKEIGLAVGRTVFHYFHLVQTALLFFIIALCLLTKMVLVQWLIVSGVILCFFWQTV